MKLHQCVKFTEEWSQAADYLKMVNETNDSPEITAALVAALGRAKRDNEIGIYSELCEAEVLWVGLYSKC